MNNQTAEVITESFTDVLENIAFMFAEVETDKQSVETPTEALFASVDFKGEQSGSVFLVVPTELCNEITANILGLDPDAPEIGPASPDAIKELANVTCGHVLTEMVGTAPEFDLSAPQAKTVDGEQWEQIRDLNDTFVLTVDGDCSLLLSVVMKK